MSTLPEWEAKAGKTSTSLHNPAVENGAGMAPWPGLLVKIRGEAKKRL